MRIFVYLAAIVLIVSAAHSAMAANPPVVLFDQAHGEPFVPHKEAPLNLTKLGDLFLENGFDIRIGRDSFSADTLQGIDAVVISGAFKPLSPHEIDTLSEFIRKGGRLAVMLHIAPPLSGLLARLGIVHSNGVVHEQGAAVIGNESLNFHVAPQSGDPLFAGVPHFAVYGSWALDAEAPAVLAARTGRESWVDLNRNQTRDAGDPAQAFGIVALGTLGEGNFVVFADDALFQDRYLESGNLTLARNLVRRLQP